MAYYSVHAGPSTSRLYQPNPRMVRTDHQPFSLLNGLSTSDHRLYNQHNSVFDDDDNSSSMSAGMSAGMTASQATPTFQLVRKASIRTTPRPQLPKDNPIRIDIYSVGVMMESKITGQLYDPDQVKVEAEAPSGRVIRMAGDGHYSAQFTPDEIGRWRVSMYYRNKFMDGCPVDVCDPSQVRVRELRGGHIGKMLSFLVDCMRAGQGDLVVDVTHKGKKVKTSVTETSTPKLYKVTYTPYDPGPYEVNVQFNNAEVRDSDFNSTDPEERQRRALFNTTVTYNKGVIVIKASCDWEVDYVTGGPFIVHATDSSNIEVYGMKDGTVCSNPELMVDCTKVGEGNVTADVTHNGVRCPCKVRKDQPAMYRVSFKPRGPGVYKIWMNYEGSPVKGSPFVQEIAELGSPQAYGDGLVRGMPGIPQTFTVDPRGHPGHITAEVDGPLQSVPCQLTPQSDGTLSATYVPRETGPHSVDVRLDGKPIEGSPYKLNVVDPSRVRPHVTDQGSIPLHVNKEKMLPFDVSNAGLGELSAEVRGPSGRIPVAIDARNDGRHTVLFTPREEGKHYMDVKWGGFPLVHSPYEGYAVRDPEPPVLPVVDDLIVPTSLTQQHSKPPHEDKDIIHLTVGQEKELPFDTADSGPGQLTATARGLTKHVPVTVVERVPGKPSVFFTPQEEGKYLIDVDWNGSPLTSSPFIGFATREPNNNVYPPPPVSPLQQDRVKDEDKEIIPLKVHQTRQIPFDTSKAGPGQLTATVRGPTHTVPHTVEDRGDGKPVVSFTPQEEGTHYIDVEFNGTPLPQSPLLGHATRDPQPNGYPSPSYIGSLPTPRMKDEDKEILPLKVHQTKQIPFDTSKAGPGQLTATVRGPTHTVPHTVEDRGDGKPVVSFTPQEEGTHYIDVEFNGTPLPQSPLLGHATRDPQPNGYPPPSYLGSLPTPRMKDEDKEILPLKVHQTKQIPFDTSKAGPGQLTATVRGPTHTVPHTVEDRGDGKPVVSFTPQEEGPHYIDVDFNGTPLPQSPLLGFATRDPQPNGYPSNTAPVFLADRHPPDGIIPLKVNKEKALPFDATRAGPGKLTGQVRGPTRDIPVRVEDRKDGRPTMFFTPEEEGDHRIEPKWNGMPVAQSPLSGYAAPDDTPAYHGLPPVYLAGYHPRGGKPYDRERDIIPLKVNEPKQLPFDATEAGPGTMTAAVRGPSRQIPVHVEDRKNGKPSLNFTPEEIGRHLIDVDWNGKPVPTAPFVGHATRDPQPVLITPGSSRAPSVRGEDPNASFLSSQPSLADSQVEPMRVLPVAAPRPGKTPDKVVLSGKGLKEAEVDKPAHFTVDGTQATPGKPTAALEGVKTNVPVHTQPDRPQVYKCTYVPTVPGAYKLHLKWNDQPLRGSPFKVNVRRPPKAQGVVHPPKDSRPVKAGQDVTLNIDDPDPNQLSVTCTDDQGHLVPHRFLDNLDGTHSLKITPTRPGRHRVDIKRNGQHIMGSPYYIDVTAPENTGRVRVWGPGIEKTGVVNQFTSHFWVDTTGAGSGELSVRIMGPKGGFKVRMRQSNEREKLYQCFYDPVERGVYTVYVKWSGQDVDGSPFTVFLAQNQQELDLMGPDLRDPRLGPPSPYTSNGSVRDGGYDFLY
ncbi:filamin-A-like [Babylonia areolata]|uniref:filamin-A-like n=1 Tax=Babylonia areolata TaxID=304850 RepID=UPI003FD63E35